METYVVSRKILSWGPTYEVTASGSEDVLLTVKGKLVTATPKLTMVKAAEGEEVAHMTGNFLRTKFEMTLANKEKLADLTIPTIAFKKSFTLNMGGQDYKAAGGLLATNFKCNDANGQPLFEVVWELSWKDKFVINIHGAVPKEVAVLATVAIHQKYYEGQEL